METKWTPGPWIVTMEQKWPFDIAVTPNIVLMGRIAYSTAQKTLADVRKAIGFKHDQREETVRLVAEQEANARLIAAAPDLYAALDAILLSSDGGQAAINEPLLEAARVALAKALGEA